MTLKIHIKLYLSLKPQGTRNKEGDKREGIISYIKIVFRAFLPINNHPRDRLDIYYRFSDTPTDQGEEE